MVLQSVEEGLDATIENLLEFTPLTLNPIYYRFDGDPSVPIGSSWVNIPRPFPSIPGLAFARRRSLWAWITGSMVQSGFSLQMKMWLFWHEHFPINNYGISEYGHHYAMILYNNGLKNYKTIVEEITICPAMLTFLNGDLSTAESPNENYARELLELFTIGIGPEAGPGDYTNYTEEDVIALAKALTGWRAKTYTTGEIGSTFHDDRHDQETKQLSHRFENEIIENLGTEEYKKVIDIILSKEKVSHFIVRQIHKWFVGPEITEEIENDIISPLAEIFRQNDYEIKPVLQTLLKSEYFLDTAKIGCIIAHPIDFMLRILNTLEYPNGEDQIKDFFFWFDLYELAKDQDMQVLDIPSVAGWKAYYQGPLFQKIWINSVSLGKRSAFVDRHLSGFTYNGYEFNLDLIRFLEQFEEVLDPNVLIDECVQVFFSFPISQNQHDYLKNILLPGLPDFEWTVEYSEFLADPNNPDRREAIRNKLQGLFSSIFKMPEFYLI